MAIVRDFTDNAKEKLKGYVQNQGLLGWGTDWVSDLFISDKISDYGNNIDNYHKSIIDKKNVASEQIDSIFNNVYSAETDYSGQFSNLSAQFEAMKTMISNLAEIFNPTPVDGGDYWLTRPPEVFAEHITLVNKELYNQISSQLYDEKKKPPYNWDEIERILNKNADDITETEYQVIVDIYLKMDDEEIEKFYNICLKNRLNEEINKSEPNFAISLSDSEVLKNIQKHLDDRLWQGGDKEAFDKLTLLNTMLKSDIQISTSSFEWIKPNSNNVITISRNEDNSFCINPCKNISLSDGVISTRSKEITFGLKHPIIALQIGQVESGKGNTNVSTNSTRFANAFGLNDDNGLDIKGRSDEGSQVNALRHLIWQATITNKYGEDIALEIGNAHEEQDNALQRIGNPYRHHYDSLTDADQSIDLLNNEIARKLGASSNDMSMKEITKKMLDHAHENGLNTVKVHNGKYVIEVQKISDEEYEDALKTLESLDENGFPPGDQYYRK